APALGKAWTFDGTDWSWVGTSVTDGGFPVYDAARGRMLLVMQNGAVYRYSGASWDFLATNGTPPNGTIAGVAADPARGVVAFDSNPNQTSVLVDTTWIPYGPSYGPQHQTDAAVAYDGDLQAVVAFGGGGYFGGAFDTTLTFGDQGWSDITPGAP